MRNQARIQRLHGAAHRAQLAHIKRMTQTELWEYARNMMSGYTRQEVAARMRLHGKYTETMIRDGLECIFAPYPDSDRLPGKPR